jgi:hypothetical protein
VFKNAIWIIIIFFFFGLTTTFASIGVGISNGKIVVTEKLKPGAIYNLPDFVVFNTGTEITDYGVGIKYDKKQAQLKPESSWFKFSPQTFPLAPKASQNVKASLVIPLNAYPGNYFAYIEAHPIVSTLQGTTSVGVAAASKLYFTVIPSNTVTAVYYRIISLLTQYAPWDYIVISSILIILISLLIGKKFKIQIGIKKKK